MNAPGPGRWLVALVAAALALNVNGATAPATPRLPVLDAGARYVAGELLVKFKPGVDARARRQALATRGHVALAALSRPAWVRVRIDASESVESAIAAYRSDPRVDDVQPNYRYHALRTPNDPRYQELWALRNSGQVVPRAEYDTGPIAGTAGDDINAEAAWDHITDCSSVVVAVVDTGVNYNHEELAGNMWDGGTAFPHHGWDYIDADDDPMDLVDHGTHVAGIIGATGNNALGVTGVCWKASIMALRVLDYDGGSTVSVVSGVDFAVAHGAKVINMSLGGGGPDPLFIDAITNAQQHDVVVVVAAGNSTVDHAQVPDYPCDFTQANLICVAALDPSYALAFFSDWGATSVDVGAPGTNILSSTTGVLVRIEDPLSDWEIGSGWSHNVRQGYDFLDDPFGWPTTHYAPNLLDVAAKTFNVPRGDRVLLNFYLSLNLAGPDDVFSIGVDPRGQDPFGPGAFVVPAPGPVHGGTAHYPQSLEITACANQIHCRIGFRLATGAATTGDRGVSLALVSIDALTLTPDAYQVLSGTSMASPEVAGLAAMLRAYNPLYTYQDTVSAIQNAGRPVPSLAGKTTTGRAIDVMASLAYLHPPTGLVANTVTGTTTK